MNGNIAISGLGGLRRWVNQIFDEMDLQESGWIEYPISLVEDLLALVLQCARARGAEGPQSA